MRVGSRTAARLVLGLLLGSTLGFNGAAVEDPVVMDFGATWKTMFAPDEMRWDWIDPGFDDSSWTPRPAAYSSQCDQAPPGSVGTPTWPQPNLWLRLHYHLDVPTNLKLTVRAQNQFWFTENDQGMGGWHSMRYCSDAADFPVVLGVRNAGDHFLAFRVWGGDQNYFDARLAAEGPSAPESLRVDFAPSDDGVEVSWSPPVSEGGSPLTGYHLQRTDYVTGESGPIVELAAGDRSYLDHVPDPARAWRYTLVAVNALGLSPAAVADLAAPDPPTPPRDATVQPGDGPSQIQLTWSPPAQPGDRPITHFTIFRGTPGADATEVGRVGPDTTMFVDDDAGGSSSFDYWVSVSSSAGESPRAGPASAASPLCAGDICYFIRYTNRIIDVYGADIIRNPVIDETVALEKGRFYVRPDPDTFESIPVVMARVPGRFSPEAALTNDAGTLYVREESFCVADTCSFRLADGAETGAPKVGELWESRLDRYEDGQRVSSLPFVSLRQW